jgi:cell division protein FtsL
MKQKTYNKLEKIFYILIAVFISLSIILILFWIANQAWEMNNLHNQCIQECIEINKKFTEIMCVC